MELKDESIMPFGKHKGFQMQAIPDDYLLSFWFENKVAFQTIAGNKLMKDDARAVMEYIEDSFNESQL